MTPSTPASSSAWLTSLGWVTFAVLMVYAVLIGGGFAGIYVGTLRMASLVIAGVGLGAWFVLALRHPRWRPSTAIWPTLVLPVAALVLATLASDQPRLGVEYVAWAVLLVGLYLLLVQVLATRAARDRIGGLAAILSLVVGVLYIGTVLMAWMEWWDLIGGFAVPPLRPLYASLSLGGPGTVQTVQILTAAVAIAGLGLVGRRRQALAAVIVAITAAVVVISASRTGWAALGAALVLTAGLWAVMAARSGSLRSGIAARLAQRGVRLALVAAVAGAGIAAVLLAPVVLDRLLGSGAGGRDQYFTVALRMFREAPLLGHGPGSWAVERVAYTRAGELDHYVPHAHDVYLQTLAELGILGAILGMLALVPVVWLAWRALGSPSADVRRWGWCAVFVLLFLGLFNVFDFQMNVPAVFVLGALPIAWLDATSTAGIGLGRAGGVVAAWVGRAARAALWLGGLVAVLVLARAESVAMTHQGAVNAVYAADWDVARPLASDAYGADPDYAAYAITRGLVASAEADWETAGQAYRFAAETDDMSQSWLGLAQAQEALGASDAEVAGSIVRALRIGDQQPSVVFAAASLYDLIGLSGRADALYATTLARYPSLAADPYWSRDEDIRARFEAIVAAAAERSPDAAWEVALMADDVDLARRLAAGDATSEAIVAAWLGDAAALEAVFALADDAPDSPYLLSWASRLAAREGDQEQADRYQRLAVFEVTEGGELPGTEVRIDSEGYLDAVPAGTKVGFAGHYLYRRALVPDLLPPGLPRLVFDTRDDALDQTEAQ